MIHALGSRHAGPGLSKNNPTSMKDKAKWRTQASTRCSRNYNVL